MTLKKMLPRITLPRWNSEENTILYEKQSSDWRLLFHYVKQLDLSGCWLDGVNMSNRKLLDAKFTDCVLTNVNMESAELCFANFSGSHLENCSMKYTTPDEINLRDATLKNCALSYILLAHGNFAHATFYKSDLFNCRIANTFTNEHRY